MACLHLCVGWLREVSEHNVAANEFLVELANDRLASCHSFILTEHNLSLQLYSTLLAVNIPLTITVVCIIHFKNPQFLHSSQSAFLFTAVADER